MPSSSRSLRPFSTITRSITRMAIKDDDTVEDMLGADLAAYNTINCMKPEKFRQVLAGKLSCS